MPLPGIDGAGILLHCLPERKLDDRRRVIPHSELKEEHTFSLSRLQKTMVALLRPVPAFVLGKRAVGSQIHGHGAAAVGAVRHEFRRNTHILLRPQHCPDRVFIVESFLPAWQTALEKPEIPLRVEEASFSKPAFWKQWSTLVVRTKYNGLTI